MDLLQHACKHFGGMYSVIGHSVSFQLHLVHSVPFWVGVVCPFLLCLSSAMISVLAPDVPVWCGFEKSCFLVEFQLLFLPALLCLCAFLLSSPSPSSASCLQTRPRLVLRSHQLSKIVCGFWSIMRFHGSCTILEYIDSITTTPVCVCGIWAPFVILKQLQLLFLHYHLSQHPLLCANDPRVTDVDWEVWLTPNICSGVFRNTALIIFIFHIVITPASTSTQFSLAFSSISMPRRTSSHWASACPNETHCTTS